MIELKKLSLDSNDEAELRALRMMTETNDTFLTLKTISPEEHQQTLAHICHRLTELEHKYGLDILTQID